MHTTITTAEQLLAAGDIGRCELVAGELVMMTPAGGEHGEVVMNLARELSNHVKKHRLGVVYAAETGFLLARDPDTVRAPDVAFVRAERRAETATAGFIPGAPDLAVEVLSPQDRPRAVEAKVRGWLEAGARAVWVVDLRHRAVTIHASDGAEHHLGEGDRLDAGGLIPGFEIQVAEIFR